MRSIRFADAFAPGRPPLLLDGAMGTALQALGLDPGALPEAWLLERPDRVAGVHRGHLAAGAQVLLTCAFNVAAPRAAALLGPGPRGPAIRRLCLAAVGLARAEAAAAPGVGVLVAGALGPLAVASPGGGAPDREALTAPLRPALEALAEGGADLLWLESQYDRREATAALEAALPLGLPVVLTFTLAERGGLLVAPDGTPAEALLVEAAQGGAAAVGVNCVAPGPALTALAAWAHAALTVPFVAKPSPGLPGRIQAPEPFALAVRPAVEAGARLVGACCGSTPAHLAALARVLGRPG